MRIPDNECLFWVTLALYLGGAALAVGATTLLAVRAVKARKTLRERIAAGRAAAARHVARQEKSESLPQDERQAASEAENDLFHREFEEAVCRPWITYTDTFLTPELTELAITEDQISELKLPALLVAVGVITSTAGSVLSLFL